MSNSNVMEIISLLKDKQYLEENKIKVSNIIDAIKTAQSEFQELEDLVNQECSNGISFEALCDKLGGHNEYFSKKYPDTSYFDLNYKSLLVTIKQEINNDNIKEAVTVAKNCVYIYPDNISDTKTYDEMCILDFENKESLKERFTLLEYQLSEEQKTESSISYQRKEKIMDELKQKDSEKKFSIREYDTFYNNISPYIDDELCYEDSLKFRKYLLKSNIIPRLQPENLYID